MFKEGSGVTLEGLKKGINTLSPYMVSKKTGSLIVRKPGAFGEHDGVDFALAELKDCTVLICDRTEQISIDFLENCYVLLGPCNTSTFIRDCKNCTFWCATRQFRTRDCKSCDFYLYSNTDPIIESSENLRIAP